MAKIQVKIRGRVSTKPLINDDNETGMIMLKNELDGSEIWVHLNKSEWALFKRKNYHNEELIISGRVGLEKNENEEPYLYVKCDNLNAVRK